MEKSWKIGISLNKKKVTLTHTLTTCDETDNSYWSILCKVSKICFDLLSRLAFSLSLTESKCIFSSSLLDYCSRIAGNTSNQDVAVLRRITLERCTLNWQIDINSKEMHGRRSDTKTPMKNKQNETHGYNRTDHCGTKA